MSLLISRLLFTAFILAAAYFALVKVWTKRVDILALFKSPSDVIPVAEEQRERIIVNPAQINMTATEWGKTRVVEIRNTSPTDPAYSIWVKIWAESPDWNPHELQILTESGESFLSEEFLGVSTSFDLVKILAVDSQRRPCIFLLLYRLGGLESRMLKIKRGATGQSDPAQLLLSLSSRGHSAEPAPIASQTDKVALQIKPPESLQIRAVSFLMKRGP